MSKIKLTGDSSGYVEISAPSAAGNNTLELPSSGSKVVVADASDNVNVAGILTSVGGLNVGTGGTVITTTAGGDINIDSGGVYYDASNNRFGIGTASPGSILHLQQSASAAVGPDLRLTNNAGTASDKARVSFFGGVSPTIRGALDFNINSSGVGELIWSSGEGSVTEKFRCDSSGRVTMPYQPAVNYSIQVNTGTGVRTFTSKRTRGSTGLSSVAAGNGSSHGSVGRFTAPVSGVYLFTCRGRNTPTISNNELLSVYGSWSTGINVLAATDELLDTRGASIGNDGFGATFTLYLSANDYWELDWYRPAPTTYLGSTIWDISILLIG